MLLKSQIMLNYAFTSMDHFAVNLPIHKTMLAISYLLNQKKLSYFTVVSVLFMMRNTNFVVSCKYERKKYDKILARSYVFREYYSISNEDFEM